MNLIKIHKPVLLKESLEMLDPKPGEFFIDATYGSGGHSRAIKEKIGHFGKLLAIDWEKTGENYADLPLILIKKGLPKADGLIADLGFSSEQLSSGRGFSFLKDEPLLMTYGAEEKPVKQIIRELAEEELADIIYKYGEERFSRQIAKEIKKRGRSKPIETTGELVKAILNAVPKSYASRVHPATRTFMALRIYANRELENLEILLGNLPHILKPGGRAAIISFHSLEDRIVKKYFKNLEKVGQIKILTKKPIVPTREEIKTNPRARSAKLRAVQIT